MQPLIETIVWILVFTFGFFVIFGLPLGTLILALIVMPKYIKSLCTVQYEANQRRIYGSRDLPVSKVSKALTDKKDTQTGKKVRYSSLNQSYKLRVLKCMAAFVFAFIMNCIFSSTFYMHLELGEFLLMTLILIFLLSSFPFFWLAIWIKGHEVCDRDALVQMALVVLGLELMFVCPILLLVF